MHQNIHRIINKKRINSAENNYRLSIKEKPKSNAIYFR